MYCFFKDFYVLAAIWTSIVVNTSSLIAGAGRNRIAIVDYNKRVIISIYLEKNFSPKISTLLKEFIPLFDWIHNACQQLFLKQTNYYSQLLPIEIFRLKSSSPHKACCCDNINNFLLRFDTVVLAPILSVYFISAFELEVFLPNI